MTDFIVVGAGSAGAVVASELASRGHSVLLVEAGPSLAAVPPALRRPAHYLRSFGSAFDWDLRTTPQPELARRSIRWPRGRGEGGSSLINAMIWLRARPQDFAAWAEIAGESWSSLAIEPTQSLLEEKIDQGLERLRYLSPTTRAAIDASSQLWPSNPLARQQVVCRRGERVTTADLFLPQQRLDRTLRRVTGQTVSRILIDNGRASGIELAGGQRIASSQGVVLCAGAIGSPKLLFASGIGPAEQLRLQGIAPIVDAPQVGQNLQDHLVVPLIYETQPRFRFSEHATRAQTDAQKKLGRGPLVSNLAEASCLLDLPEPFEDRHEAIQLFVTPTHYLKYPQADAPAAMTLAVVGTRPASRGSINFTVEQGVVTSQIDPRYLSDPNDLAALVAAVPLARQLAAQERLQAILRKELLPGTDRLERTALERYITRYAQTLYHPVGTCRMGLDEAAVVDSRLAVRGLERLWVADASVFPTLTTTNPQATVLAVALRVAEWIGQ